MVFHWLSLFLTLKETPQHWRHHPQYWSIFLVMLCLRPLTWQGSTSLLDYVIGLSISGDTRPSMSFCMHLSDEFRHLWLYHMWHFVVCHLSCPCLMPEFKPESLYRARCALWELDPLSDFFFLLLVIILMCRIPSFYLHTSKSGEGIKFQTHFFHIPNYLKIYETIKPMNFQSPPKGKKKMKVWPSQTSIYTTKASWLGHWILKENIGTEINKKKEKTEKEEWVTPNIGQRNQTHSMEKRKSLQQVVLGTQQYHAEKWN